MGLRRYIPTLVRRAVRNLAAQAVNPQCRIRAPSRRYIPSFAGVVKLVARLIDTHLPIAPRPLPSIPLRGSLDGWVAALLPFNRGRRFAGDVVDDAGDVGHFVDDAA